MAAALIDSSYVTRSCGSMCVCVRARANPCLYWVNRGSPSEVRAPTLAAGKLSPEPGSLRETASIMLTTEMETN